MYIFYSFLKTGWIRPVQNGIIWKTEATFDAREKKVQDQYKLYMYIFNQHHLTDTNIENKKIASKLLLQYFLC